MTFEESLKQIVREVTREVIREELGCLLNDKPEELLRAEDVRKQLNFNHVSKVYALVREGELEAIMISKRGMRFAPSAVREFQLKRGIKAA